MSNQNVESMLTTIDNPFNPFTDWEKWYAWDFKAGYHTPEYLARIVRSSYEISEADQNLAIDDAIDEIIQEHDSGFYRRITKEEKVNVEKAESI